jgi:hypothetical protein
VSTSSPIIGALLKPNKNGTEWNRTLLEKLVVVQLLKKFPAF